MLFFSCFQQCTVRVRQGAPDQPGAELMAYILAADENALVVDLMSIFLSQEGHEFLSANSLPALVSILEDGEQVPDVLILSADLEPGFLAELIYELRGLMG